MGMWRLHAFVLCAYLVLSHTCSASSSVFRAGSYLSALKNNLFKKDGNRERSYGFNVRKVCGKLAIHSRSGDVIHLSVGVDGLLTQKLKGKPSNHLPIDKYAEEVDGIFGFYKLPAGYFAAVIKRSEPLVGTSLPDIRRVTNIKLVKVPSSVPVSYHNFNATELELEQARAETLLLRTFKQHAFYFSTGSYDITRTLQNNAQSGPEQHKMEPEAKFFWNRNALAPLIANNCTAFVTPMVNAWIGSANISYEGGDYLLTLISRRSWRRQGPRYIKRGSDESGDVANYVETEQIVQRCDGQATTSFVQVRGSIPLYWTQPADWKLRPPVLTVPSTQPIQHARALKTHLVDMVSSYFPPIWARAVSKASASQESVLHKHNKNPQQENGDKYSIHMINLIDKKGVQGKLGQLWRKVLGIVLSQHVLLLPRIGAHTRDSGRHAAFKIGTDSGGAGVVESSEGADNTASLDSVAGDRNATTVLHGVLNVTAADLLRSHSVQEYDLFRTSHDGDSVSPHQQSDESISVATQWIWFDYHHKCHDSPAAVLELFPLLQRAIHTDNLYLQTNLSSGISDRSHGATSAASSAAHVSTDVRTNKYASNVNILRTQTHIIRTNCMDCLDRTNVMQSVVARWVLMRQIVALRAAVPPAAEGDGARLLRVNNYKSLELPDQRMESEFRKLWTENGDHLSVMYAGSRAMKRDVTQNGVRTQRGAVDDAMSAAQRFFGNNLRDQHKQLGIDLLLGLADYETLTRNAHIAGNVPAQASVPHHSVGAAPQTSHRGDGTIISGGSVAGAKKVSTDKSASDAEKISRRVRSTAAAPLRSGSGPHHPAASQGKGNLLTPAAPLSRDQVSANTVSQATLAVSSAAQDGEAVPPAKVKAEGMDKAVVPAAPVDPALRSSEHKIEVALADLLEEVSQLQRAVPPGTKKIRTKMEAKKGAVGEVYVIEKQRKQNAGPRRVIEQTQYRRSSAEKQLQQGQSKSNHYYVKKLRNIVLGLAPIVVFLKYVFRM